MSCYISNAIDLTSVVGVGCREDASVASNEPSGVSACDGAPAASYTVSPVTQCCYIALLHCMILCNSTVTDTVLRCAVAALLHAACCLQSNNDGLW